MERIQIARDEAGSFYGIVSGVYGAYTTEACRNRATAEHVARQLAVEAKKIAALWQSR